MRYHCSQYFHKTIKVFIRLENNNYLYSQLGNDDVHASKVHCMDKHFPPSNICFLFAQIIFAHSKKKKLFSMLWTITLVIHPMHSQVCLQEFDLFQTLSRKAFMQKV